MILLPFDPPPNSIRPGSRMPLYGPAPTTFLLPGSPGKNVYGLGGPLPSNTPSVAKLPGTSGFFQQKSQISGKNIAPGSEAAQEKWFFPKKVKFLEKVLPQAAKLPGTSGSFPQSQISGKKLPQAAKLPGRSGSFPKKSNFWKKFCPSQRSCPGQVASSKKKKSKSRKKVRPR